MSWGSSLLLKQQTYQLCRTKSTPQVMPDFCYSRYIEPDDFHRLSAICLSIVDECADRRLLAMIKQHSSPSSITGVIVSRYAGSRQLPRIRPYRVVQSSASVAGRHHMDQVIVLRCGLVLNMLQLKENSLLKDRGGRQLYLAIPNHRCMLQRAPMGDRTKSFTCEVF